MKKSKQFLYFLALLTLILTLPNFEVPSIAQTGTSVATPSDAEETLPEDSLFEEILTEETTLEEMIQEKANAEPLEVIKVITPYSDALILAERQNARELLETKLENSDFSTAVVLFSDRSRKFYSIQYDIDALDLTQTGLFSLNGTINVPEDGSISIPPELVTVTLPVFLYDPLDPCELPVISSDPVRDSQLLLSQNSSSEDLQKSLKNNNRTYLYFDNGIFLSVPLIWDISSVSFGIPGTYRIYGIPDLPKGVLLNSDFSSYPCDVIIQKTGVFSLTPPTFDGISFMTRWTKPTPQREKFRRYYAIGDDGPWQEDTTGSFMRIESFNTQSMYVFYYENVLFEVPYYFQLEYDGEYSNILKIYLTEDDLYYDLIEGDRDGGDREEQPPPAVTLPPDHTDKTPPLGTAKPEEIIPPEVQPEITLPEETEPAETQPADQDTAGHSGSSAYSKPPRHSTSSDLTSGPGYQEAETVSASLSPLLETEPSIGTQEKEISEPSEEATTIAAGPMPEKETETTVAISAPASSGQEADTADYTILSGKRIHKELELNPGRPIVITKHRIRLEIPAEAGLFSSMSEQSLFQAELTSLAENRILLILSMDGVPLVDLPSMTITMPWKASDETPILEVTNEDGKVLGTAAYLDSSAITFPLSETGVFTIKPQTSSADLVTVIPPAPAASAYGQTSDSISAGSSSIVPVVCVFLTGILISCIFILFFYRRKRRNQP